MANVRDLKRVVARSRLLGPLAGVVDRTVPWRQGQCAVLTFHRIDTGDPALYPGLASVDPRGFEDVITAVARTFHPITVQDFVAALVGDAQLPERAALVTIDDAYRDVAEVAWPVLQRVGVPAVLFVPTDYPDHPERTFWWDRLHAAFHASGPDRWAAVGADGSSSLDAFRSVRARLKSMPHADAMAEIDTMVATLGDEPLDATPRVASWDTLRRLAGEGLAMAPHSRSHPMLDQLPPDQLEAEIAGSRADLCAHIGDAATIANVFAYPAGGHDPTVRSAVVAAGYDAAFTTERGVADVGRDDRHRIPRLNIGATMTPALLRAEAAARRLRRSAKPTAEVG